MVTAECYMFDISWQGSLFGSWLWLPDWLIDWLIPFIPRLSGHYDHSRRLMLEVLCVHRKKHGDLHSESHLSSMLNGSCSPGVLSWDFLVPMWRTGTYVLHSKTQFFKACCFQKKTVVYEWDTVLLYPESRKSGRCTILLHNNMPTLTAGKWVPSFT